MRTQEPDTAPPVIVKVDPEEKRQELRRLCKSLAFRIAKLRNEPVGYIHAKWINDHNGNPQEDASIEELERKLLWLTKWKRRLES